MKILLNLSAALLLTACASDAVNDPIFKAGYDAGCGMAGASAEARRAMMNNQPDLYRRGFNSGVQACGGVRDVAY